MKKYETRKLSFQLVPMTSWYTNLRSLIPNWSELSNKVRSSCQCEICGRKFDKSKLDAHEVWEYDDKNHIQKLKKIISVCDDCHNTIHIGHANIVGKTEEAIDQYMKINDVDYTETMLDIQEAFKDWERRSLYGWQLEDNLIEKVENMYNISCNIDKPIEGKYYAVVSYENKEEAKKLGAKWDWDKKMWYFSSEEKSDEWNNHINE